MQPELAYVRNYKGQLCRVAVVDKTPNGNCEVVYLRADEYDVEHLRDGKWRASDSNPMCDAIRTYVYPTSALMEFESGHYVVMRERANRMLTEQGYNLILNDHQHYRSLYAGRVYSPEKHPNWDRTDPPPTPFDTSMGYAVFETEPGILACTCPQYARWPTVCKHTEFFYLKLKQLASNPGRGSVRYGRVLRYMCDPVALLERRRRFEAELDLKMGQSRTAWYADNVNKDF